MDPSSRFCLFLAFWSVLEFYKLILPVVLGFFLMDCAWSFKILTQMGDFRCGFVVSGCSSSLGNLILLLFMAFGLGLRVLRFGGLRRCLCEFMEKSRVLRGGFCSKSVRNDEFAWRRKDFDCGDHRSDDFPATKEEDEEEEECSGDESFSVPALRKMVKTERRRADAALNDLEKERMAAASAAEESMAMILRIQNEKSALQMEVKQMRRLVEDKQAYDQEVIQSLEWTVMQYEEGRGVLEQQLKLCKKRLQQMCVEDDDDDELLDCIAGASTPRLVFGDLQADSKWQEQSSLNVKL